MIMLNFTPIIYTFFAYITVHEYEKEASSLSIYHLKAICL